MTTRTMTKIGAALFLAVWAAPAAAHTGIGTVAGFTAGFSHPLVGVDHLLAMVAVGLFAGLIGGRAVWVVPLSFLAAMLIGGVLGLAGLALPAVETTITVSVIILGLVVALGRAWPVAAATIMVGAFALFHGHAHGAEMDAGHGAILYSAGFLAATALLHAAGLGIARFNVERPLVMRAAGLVVAVAGAALAAI